MIGEHHAALSALGREQPRREPRHDVLFEPVQIGPKTLRNRFYQVPHCTGFGSDKPWTQAQHRGCKAEGGWAAVCTEYCSISPESDEQPYVSARLWDDEDVRALSLMADEAHRHGSLAGIELWHGGMYAENRESRLVPVAPSGWQSDYDGVTHARQLEKHEIREVQQAWVDAARRARSAGFDIVYVYGSHAYLPTQFLSPVFNRRSDEYGGSFENRARFWLEAIELVSEAIGDDCAIAVRIAADRLDWVGVELEEGLAFVRAADGLVDLWDVVVGAMFGAGRIDSGPSRFFDQGYQEEYTRRFREATAKPIVGVGRYTDADRMAQIVGSGQLDLIGAARPTISDPWLPRKIEEGRYAEIRECIGCNACYSRSIWGMHLGCTQNATAGEEHRRSWHPERFDRAEGTDRGVLVVGAGPAGMECAIVLAKRGFELVHLVDADEETGGHVRWVIELPGLAQWGRVLDWRRSQLERLAGVEFIPGTRLDAAGVRDYGAQVVICATGSRWRGDGLSGMTREPIAGADASLAWCLTPEQVMVEGKRPPGQRVLVYDCEGYFTGAGMAELLRGEGHDVVLATPWDLVAHHTDQTLEGWRLRRRLNEIGVEQRRATTLSAAEQGVARGEDEFGSPLEIASDALVLVTQRDPLDGLWRELAADQAALEREGIEQLHRVGDCLAPRLLADAIFDGHRLGRELDAPGGGPVMWLRERALVPR